TPGSIPFPEIPRPPRPPPPPPHPSAASVPGGHGEQGGAAAGCSRSACDLPVASKGGRCASGDQKAGAKSRLHGTYLCGQRDLGRGTDEHSAGGPRGNRDDNCWSKRNH
uniref:Uncharacterized protein n=1 Tax=Aegilops tauschii subsp. strangulata TaxID=200361 RepID=A0A453NDF3_AEGTS